MTQETSEETEAPDSQASLQRPVSSEAWKVAALLKMPIGGRQQMNRRGLAEPWTGSTHQPRCSAHCQQALCDVLETSTLF